MKVVPDKKKERVLETVIVINQENLSNGSRVLMGSINFNNKKWDTCFLFIRPPQWLH